ncbi:MAG: hypothetical protein QXO27_04210, partial [Candidatus Aenigmatarchaeota archaeon]
IRKYNFLVLCIEKKEEFKKQIITTFKEKIKEKVKLKVEEFRSDNTNQFKIVFYLRTLNLKEKLPNLIDFCKEATRLNYVLTLEGIISFDNSETTRSNYLVFFRELKYNYKKIQNIFELIKNSHNIIHKEVVNKKMFIIINHTTKIAEANNEN